MLNTILEETAREGDLFCIETEHTLTYIQHQKLEQIAKEEKMTGEQVIEDIVAEYLNL